jgi:hypothetical protein
VEQDLAQVIAPWFPLAITLLFIAVARGSVRLMRDVLLLLREVEEFRTGRAVQRTIRRALETPGLAGQTQGRAGRRAERPPFADSSREYVFVARVCSLRRKSNR